MNCPQIEYLTIKNAINTKYDELPKNSIIFGKTGSGKTLYILRGRDYFDKNDTLIIDAPQGSVYKGGKLLELLRCMENMMSDNESK